jgi:hypothetical protein
VTLDRDIRLTPEQIEYLDNLARWRISQLGKSIARAEEQRRAGVRIQWRVLEEHQTEVAELGFVRDALGVARQQIQRQIMAGLGMKGGEDANHSDVHTQAG